MMQNSLKTKRFCKQALINAAIAAIILLGAGNILHALPFHFPFPPRLLHNNYTFFAPQMIALHRSLSAVTGFALIFISYRLYKRVRTAWVAAVSLIILSLALHLTAFNIRSILRLIVLVELFILLILFRFRRDFSRTADPLNLKWGVVLAAVSLLLVLCNTMAGLFLLRLHHDELYGFYRAFSDAVHLLFFMDISYFNPKNRISMAFLQTEIFINWASIIAALFFVLKPLVYQPIVRTLDREKVRKLLLSYAANPISYVAVESDKHYFFGTAAEGVIAYTIAGSVAVCAGDPVCSPRDTALLLSEFIVYCRQNAHSICFCQVMPETLCYLEYLGFGVTKYGEEAMFELQKYELTGGKTAKIRNAVHHAARLGITVSEYIPLSGRNRRLEEDIQSVSQEWLNMKKSSELSFMLGSVSLENPMDRRYFVAQDAERNVLGFVVFVPFASGAGYMADVTRRRACAPIGVMESIIVEAFRKMKDEGVKWGSLGLAPLYNVNAETVDTQQKSIVNSMLNFIYEHMNNLYGFKTLYHYKKKYGPTEWAPRYLAYYPGSFTPQIAYSIVKAQNPKGVTDYFLAQLKHIFRVKQQPQQEKLS